jgi:hypothetical protein
MIKFAGLALKWEREYAKQYAEKLNEIGFCAKIIEQGDTCLVAYCYKPFSRQQAETALEILFKGTPTEPTEPPE